jgi:hypothetical protein
MKRAEKPKAIAPAISANITIHPPATAPQAIAIVAPRAPPKIPAAVPTVLLTKNL